MPRRHHRSFVQRPKPGKVRRPVHFVLDTRDPTVVGRDHTRLRPCRHHLEHAPERRAVQVLRVAFVEAVLRRVAPSTATDVDAPSVGELVLAQFAWDGDVDRRDAARAVADEDPHHPEPLRSRERLDRDLPAHRRVGTVGDDRAQRAVVEVERPSVVRAGDRSRELLRAERQGNASVRAAIAQRMHNALVTHEHDLAADEFDADGLALLEQRRPHHRVPPAARKAERGRLVRRPRRPVGASLRPIGSRLRRPLDGRHRAVLPPNVTRTEPSCANSASNVSPGVASTARCSAPGMITWPASSPVSNSASLFASQATQRAG